MKLQSKIHIQAPSEKIWEVITNIEQADQRISAIDKIEVLEKPDSGFVGFKWKETRTLFGKQASELMWVTEAKENESYKTRAESHGMVYLTDVYITGDGTYNYLHMDMEGTPQSFGAKVMAALTGFMFKKATFKAMMNDLNDLKEAIENG
jgi:uncharacterized membrane protein